MIREVTFTAALTDVKSVMLHAFASTGGVHYFGYVNSAGHGVVYKSLDDGATWALVSDYGTASFVAVTVARDNDIVVTVSTTGGTSVYKGWSLQRTAVVAQYGAVTFWPITFTIASGSASSTAGDSSQGALTGTNLAAIYPVYAVLGYGVNNGEYLTVSASNFDSALGYGGVGPTKLANFHVGPSDPKNPNSPMVAQFDTTLYGQQWPGLVSASYSGFVSSNDFSGTGTGGTGSGYSLTYSLANTRGTYFTGYPTTASTYVADRGLVGPHKAAFSCTVDGTLVSFLIDKNGLYGSTIDAGELQSVDSSGAVSPFDKAKIYGNTQDTWSTLCFGAGQQSGSFTVFTLTNNSNETSHTLYRLHDSDPLTRNHAANTQLLSQVTTVTSGSTGETVDPFALTTASNSLGPVRVTGTAAKFGVDLLVQACTQDGVLPNPSQSPGCSTILRELMNQSGVPYSIVRELANDGDPNGHQGGNALDLAGPSTSTVLTGASVNDGAYQEMAVICAFLRAVPSLFATVIHYDPITPSNSLYIWDGRLTTAAQFGGVTAQVVKDSISNIHISSSRSRLLAALQSPTGQAALGFGPAVTDPTTRAVTTKTVPDPFGTDRYVYVNNDGYFGNPVAGLAVEKDPAQTINFW